MPPDSETVVYRVVQEALTNVAKHARASLVTVSIGQSGKGLRVVVWDNGKGFNPRSQHEMLRPGTSAWWLCASGWSWPPDGSK